MSWFKELPQLGQLANHTSFQARLNQAVGLVNTIASFVEGEEGSTSENGEASGTTSQARAPAALPGPSYAQPAPHTWQAQQPAHDTNYGHGRTASGPPPTHHHDYTPVAYPHPQPQPAAAGAGPYSSPPYPTQPQQPQYQQPHSQQRPQQQPPYPAQQVPSGPAPQTAASVQPTHASAAPPPAAPSSTASRLAELKARLEAEKEKGRAGPVPSQPAAGGGLSSVTSSSALDAGRMSQHGRETPTSTPTPSLARADSSGTFSASGSGLGGGPATPAHHPAGHPAAAGSSPALAPVANSAAPLVPSASLSGMSDQQGSSSRELEMLRKALHEAEARAQEAEAREAAALREAASAHSARDAAVRAALDEASARGADDQADLEARVAAERDRFWRAELASREARTRALQGDLEAARAAAAAAAQAAQGVEAESASLRAEVEALRGRAAAAASREAELAALREEVGRLSNMAARLQEAASAPADSSAAGSDPSVAVLRADVLRLESVAEGLRGALAAAEARAASEASSAAAARQEAVSLREALANNSHHSPSSAPPSNEDLESLRTRALEADRERDKARADLHRLKMQFISKEQEDEDKVAWRVEAELRARLDKERAAWEAEVAAEVGAAERAKLDASREFEAARSRCAALEAAFASKEVELSNLQSALGAMAAESDVADTLRHELRVVRDKVSSQAKESLQLKSQCEAEGQARRQAEEELARVRGEAESWRARESKAVQEAGTLRTALEESLRRLHSLTSSSPDLVDRRVVAKLLVTYFEHQGKADHLRRDVLSLMASMLGMGTADRAKLGLGPGQEKGVTRKVFGVVGRVAALPLSLVEGGLAMAARRLGAGDDEDDLLPGEAPRVSSGALASSGGSLGLGLDPMTSLLVGESGRDSITDLWLEFLTQKALARGQSGNPTSPRSSRGPLIPGGHSSSTGFDRFDPHPHSHGQHSAPMTARTPTATPPAPTGPSGAWGAARTASGAATLTPVSSSGPSSSGPHSPGLPVSTPPLAPAEEVRVPPPRLAPPSAAASAAAAEPQSQYGAPQQLQFSSPLTGSSSAGKGHGATGAQQYGQPNGRGH